METRCHDEIAVVPDANNVFTTVFRVPIPALGALRRPDSASACLHSHLLAGPGWYLFIQRHGRAVTVRKVGQADSVLLRMRKQLSGLAADFALVACQSPAAHIPLPLARRVEWTIGKTLQRAEAHGLLATSFTEPFSPSRLTTEQTRVATTIAAAMLGTVANPLGCTPWQLGALGQRPPGWVPGCLRGAREIAAWRRLHSLIDGGAAFPGDRFASGHARATLTANGLLRVDGVDGEFHPRAALTAYHRGPALAHGLSANTRRQGWANWRQLAADGTVGHSLEELEALIAARHARAV